MKINTRDMRAKIQKCCEENPNCADNDKLLIATIWNKEGWGDPDLYKKLLSVSSPETIRRTRARMVQDGVIKPSEQTTDKRYEHYKEARSSLGY